MPARRDCECCRECLAAKRLLSRKLRAALVRKCDSCHAVLPAGTTRQFCNFRCRYLFLRPPTTKPHIGYVTKRQLKCSTCKKDFVAARDVRCKNSYCSEACRDGRVRVMPKVHVCIVCGKGFGHRPQGRNRDANLACSRECGWQVGRVRRDGLAIERRINESTLHQRSWDNRKFLNKIWLRDNGICHICKMKCWRNLSNGHSLGVTLDHVVPFKQGEHSEDNLKLAHRTCNSIKHDAPTLTPQIQARASESVVRTLVDLAWLSGIGPTGNLPLSMAVQ